MNVRIVNVPPGEAPEDVRAAWVGLSLPLSRASASRTRTVGVRTGPRNLLLAWLLTLLGGGQRERGYYVNAVAAVEILSRQAPAAAAWWREHAPHILRPGVDLLFHESACVLDDDGATAG